MDELTLRSKRADAQAQMWQAAGLVCVMLALLVVVAVAAGIVGLFRWVI